MYRLILISLTTLWAIIFIWLSPLIDQQLAILPYNVDNKTFFGETSIWCRFFYSAISWITTLIIVASCIFLFFNKYFKNKYLQSKVMRKGAIITLLALIIGPGLVVNTTFKDHWGRARPYQVLRDSQSFSPFWQYRANAPNNNSFPSGHASMGFFLGVPFLGLGRRRTGIIIGLACGVFIGLIRILQGGHYFSDVILSGIFVWIIAEVVLYIVNVLDKKGYLGE